MHPRSILSWWNTHVMMRNVFTDMSNAALALLANDRYLAVVSPVAYNNAEKRPISRLITALVVVVSANGIRLVGDTLWQHPPQSESATWFKAALAAQTCGDGIRAAYSLLCLCM